MRDPAQFPKEANEVLLFTLAIELGLIPEEFAERVTAREVVRLVHYRAALRQAQERKDRTAEFEKRLRS